MIKIILTTIALINFINLLLNKGKKSNTLACGLGGYNGKVPANDLLLRIIGKYNEERGIHSCGIAINNEIHPGVNGRARFSKLVNSWDFMPKAEDSTTNNVIIHTRKATMGKHTKKNAHPFGFGGTKNEPYEFIGVHNGTLNDWESLLKDIDNNKLDLDSKALLYRLYYDKNYKVLSEYKGAAALIFYNTKDPDILYAFKGAAGDIEERPLYYLKTKDGVYISSMKEPFEFAGYGDTSIKAVPNNTILTFKGGEIINELKVSRPSTLNKKSPSTNYWSEWDAKKLNGYDYGYDYGYNYETSSYAAPNVENNLIEREKVITTSLFNNRIYYKSGRYLKNNLLLNGIYYLREDGTFSDKKDTNANPYYFVKGIALKEEKDINIVKKEINSSYPSYLKISEHALYPIYKISKTTLLPEKFGTNFPIIYAWGGTVTYNLNISPEFSIFKYFYTGNRGNIELSLNVNMTDYFIDFNSKLDTIVNESMITEGMALTENTNLLFLQEEINTIYEDCDYGEYSYVEDSYVEDSYKEDYENYSVIETTIVDKSFPDEKLDDELEIIELLFDNLSELIDTINRTQKLNTDGKNELLNQVERTVPVLIDELQEFITKIADKKHKLSANNLTMLTEANTIYTNLCNF